MLVVLKFLHPDAGVRSGADRALEEARATARFAHPNIVTVYAVDEHRGAAYLVLEYLRGESLADRLRRGPLSPSEAVRVVLACARALEEAHGRGIVHRDLKPANVMVAEDGRPRVVDFGLAQVLTGTDQATRSQESPRSGEQGRRLIRKEIHRT